MKQLLRTAAVLLVALFFWRLIGVETDLATLRAGVAKTHAAPPGSTGGRRESLPISPVEAPRESVPSAGDSASANPTGFERAVEELQQAKERIAELEATVKELSDAWNQFAAEEETKRAIAQSRAQTNEETKRAIAQSRAQTNEENRRTMEEKLEAVKKMEGAARANDVTARAWQQAVADLETEVSKYRK
jgi:hypothetical protein